MVKILVQFQLGPKRNTSGAVFFDVDKSRGVSERFKVSVLKTDVG